MVTLQESKRARLGTLCALYFARRSVVITVAFVAVLVDADSINDEQVAALTLAGTLPWMFGTGAGLLIDRVRFPATGCAVLGSSSLNSGRSPPRASSRPSTTHSRWELEAGLPTIMLFFPIHNVFATLQDVSSTPSRSTSSQRKTCARERLHVRFEGFWLHVLRDCARRNPV